MIRGDVSAGGLTCGNAVIQCHPVSSCVTGSCARDVPPMTLDDARGYLHYDDAPPWTPGIGTRLVHDTIELFSFCGTLAALIIAWDWWA